MRKVRLWLALVATLLATSAGAQSNLTVTAAEYFFDSDPGYGQATVINNVRGDEVEIAIPTSNLSVGAHTLCLRTLGSNGIWSTTMTKPIFVMSTGSEVARVEYFFDNDPGYGKGSVLATSGSPDVTIEISTADIAPGAHMLYLRSQDTNGHWSSVMAHPIYVFTVLPVAALEFFIDDNDPGEGKAISVPVATATAATAIFDIDTSELTPGEHTLNIRAMGIDSVWTAVSTRRFMVEGAAEPEPYAVLTENTATDGTATPAPNRAATEKRYTLTFYYDNKKADRNGMSVGPFSDEIVNWYDNRADITTVIFDESFAACESITSTAYWFSECGKLKEIRGITNLKTGKVTDMTSMFSQCSALTSLDVSGFQTENVTSMKAMFENCSSLTDLDVSGFHTENVTNMRAMFFLCSNLSNLNVSGFNTANVTDMSYMFGGSSSLTSLDVSGFNTANVTDMSDMFGNCSSLTSLDVSGFNTDKVTDISSMFSSCTNLTSLDLSGFNTENVTRMGYMFELCRALSSLDVSGFNTANVTSMAAMFNGCSGLTSLDVSSFNTKKVTQMWSMFGSCSSLTNLDLTSFNTISVTSMDAMFSGCSSLITIYVGSDWTTAGLTDPTSVIFNNCPNLVGGMGTTYDVNHEDAEYAHIDGGTSNPGYLTDKNATTTNFIAHIIVNGEGEVSSGLITVRDAGEVEIEPGSPFQMFFYPDSAYYLGSLIVNGDDMTQGVLPATASGAASFTMQNVTSNLDIIVEFMPETPVVADPEPYAVLSDNNTVLTFYYDEKKAERNGMSVGPFTESYENGIIVGVSSGWYNQRESITKVVFEESFANYTSLTSTRSWFYGCRNLAAITGLQYLKTDNVTDMYSMFDGCSSLKSIDVSGFNTENVTQMWWMFNGCSSLTSLDLSHFNTANVKSMSAMFSGCSSLTSLDLSSFNTTNVTSMNWMFDGCQSLITLNLSNFNTANLAGTNMDDIFVNCGSLASIVAGNATISEGEYAKVKNPNLLVYVNNESLAPSNITNVVVNGFAKNIVLTDAKEGNNNWFCPQTFTAEMVNYTREFRQETTVGVSRGWEAIALPFDVQNITHEKWGAIAPFNNTQSSKHFWLRQLGENGLFSATKIEANVPYVISMPNDVATYPEEFLLAGRVTFSAENVTIPATEPRVMSLADSSIVMMPAFLRVDRSPSVWAINIGEVRGQYYEGSVFEREYRQVRPFEAYTVHRGQSPAPRFVPINSMMGETTGIEEVENAALNAESYYDLNGRKLQGKPNAKGVYITNGRKVVIK